MSIGGKAARCGLMAFGVLAGAAESRAQRYGEDTTFVFVKPCRAFDSAVDETYDRGPYIGPKSGRAFRVAGAAGLDNQGGPAAGCGVPDWATGVAVSLSVRGQQTGYLVAYAYERWELYLTSPPKAVSMRYDAGRLATGTVVSALRGQSISVYSSEKAQVWGDVVGYYAPRVAASFFADGRLVNGTSRIGAITPQSDGLVMVNVRGDITDCTPVVSFSTVILDQDSSVTASISPPDRVAVRVRPALGYMLINLSVDC